MARNHKRGGTHRVKDADRTGTIYDEWNYAQLKADCIERKLYIKDMKKVAMVHALADADNNAKNAKREARKEADRLLKERARLKKLQEDKESRMRIAKIKRRIAKQQARERDESVSDDTPDEDELRMMHNELLGVEENAQALVGQALSDESWTSTSTESTAPSKAPSIGPGYKLRLFEWIYTTMPSPTAPALPALNADGTPGEPARIIRNPVSKPYMSMKLYTTETNEKLFTPGNAYPPTVPHDHVPVLSEATRAAARNGVLLHPLREATIESASSWTKRTRIQGWNARMFFALPPRNKAKNLVDVYSKWELENRRLLRVKPIDIDAEKMSRAKRHQLRHENKAKKYAEVLEASEHRPQAMCYLPAYLDYEADKTVMKRCERNERRALDNLFYIRFPGCDVPHYYFWSRRGEWSNPTVPDPFYDSNVDMDNNWTPYVAEKRLPAKPRLTRRRNSRTSLLPEPANPPNLENTTRRLECLLHNKSLAEVLCFHRDKWRKKGMAHIWRKFSDAMPMLHPSGIPGVPPVESKGTWSIAEKLASIEIEGDETLLRPLQGGESWTRDDDGWWDVVEVVEEIGAGEKSLERRASTPTPFMPGKFSSWLEQISPSYAPLTPDPVPGTPSISREAWETQFLQPGMDVKCPFCLAELGGGNFQQQAEHVFGHSAPNYPTRMSIGMEGSDSMAVERGGSVGLARLSGGRPGNRERWISEATIHPNESISRRGTTARVRFEDDQDGDDEKMQVNFQTPVNFQTDSEANTSLLTYVPRVNFPQDPEARTEDLLTYVPRVNFPRDYHNSSSELSTASPTYLAATTPIVRRASTFSAPPNSRKRSISTISSSELLPPAKKKKRHKMPEINVTFGKGRKGKEEEFYFLARRQSDTTYQPPPSIRAPSGRKRRRIADPTYRDGPASPVEEAPFSVPEEASRKRKKVVADTTYRPDAEVQEFDDLATPRVTRRKIVGVKAGVPVLTRRRKSVDLNADYHDDSVAVESRRGSGTGCEIRTTELEEGWWAWSGVEEWCRVM